MLTATIRHDAGLPLALSRRVVMRAWQFMQAGRWWRAWCDARGIIGMVRAVEVTHGAHGWHPHVHAWLVGARDLGDDDRAEVFARWARAVDRAARAVGVDPSRVAPVDQVDGAPVGVVVGAADARYLADAGMELTDPAGAKRGAGRSPWDIARGAAAGSAHDVALWREWVSAMHGARQLTWSRSLASWRDADERAEREALEERTVTWEPIARIPGRIWDVVRWDRDAVMDAIEMARDGAGTDAVVDRILRARRMPDPRASWPPLPRRGRDSPAARAAAIARMDAELARRAEWQRARRVERERMALVARLRARAAAGLDAPHWAD